MATTDNTFPDERAPQRLLTQLCSVLWQYPNVGSIAAFGSLAGGSWDRWSDVDLVVITDDDRIDCRDLYDYLH